MNNLADLSVLKCIDVVANKVDMPLVTRKKSRKIATKCHRTVPLPPLVTTFLDLLVVDLFLME